MFVASTHFSVVHFQSISGLGVPLYAVQCCFTLSLIDWRAICCRSASELILCNWILTAVTVYCLLCGHRVTGPVILRPLFLIFASCCMQQTLAVVQCSTEYYSQQCAFSWMHVLCLLRRVCVCHQAPCIIKDALLILSCLSEEYTHRPMRPLISVRE